MLLPTSSSVLFFSMEARRMKSCFVAVAIIVLSVCSTSGLPTQPQNPIIGILTEPSKLGICMSVSAAFPNVTSLRSVSAVGGDLDDTNSSCIWAIYSEWLQASGIRSVPIPWDANATYFDFLFRSVNGILLPGGILSAGSDLYTRYFERIQEIFDKVVEANKNGDPMVLWGTCQGFEMVCCAAARSTSVLSSGFTGMNPLMETVNFTDFARDSRLFGSAPPHILKYMSTENTTLNWHEKGVTPKTFVSNQLLRRTLQPLATSQDTEGKTFVAAVEAPMSSIYAVQFHPERPQFEFTTDKIFHGPHVIEVSEYLSLFVLSQLQRNNHTFSSPEEADTFLIDNYPQKYLGYGVHIYYFAP